jgi:hypothetical protein
VLVDWYLSTRAWLLRIPMAFSFRPEMDYRQHGANMARLRGPYTRRQIVEDTARVRDHYRLVTGSHLEEAAPERLRRLKEAAEEAEVFHDRIVARPDHLARYVEELNARPSMGLWWSWVAAPALRHLWSADP